MIVESLDQYLCIEAFMEILLFMKKSSCWVFMETVKIFVGSKMKHTADKKPDCELNFGSDDIA